MHDVYTMYASNTKRNSIENQFECSHADLLRVGIAGKYESSMLETLRKDTEPRAIPEEELEQIASAIEEGEECPGQWILAQRALHEPHQTIE